MKKVLITGAAGYVGSTLTYLLLENGYEVIGVDKLLFGIVPLMGALRNPRFKLIQCDINDTDQYEQYIDSDTAIAHLAAIVGEPACKKFEADTMRTNYDGARKVINLAMKKNAGKLVFVTTCSNYGLVPKGELATEESAFHPLGLYAQSKVDIEKYLLETVTKDLNWTILRFSTVFGLSPRLRFDLTVNEFAAAGYLDKKLSVYLPHTVRPYVHAYDAARAVKLMIERPEESRDEVYNVGDSTQNYEKDRVVQEVKKLVPDLEVEYVEKGDDLRDYGVSFEKIKEKLGYHITLNVGDGVKEIIRFLSTGAITDVMRKEYHNHLI